MDAERPACRRCGRRVGHRAARMRVRRGKGFFLLVSGPAPKLCLVSLDRRTSEVGLSFLNFLLPPSSVRHLILACPVLILIAQAILSQLSYNPWLPHMYLHLNFFLYHPKHVRFTYLCGPFLPTPSTHFCLRIYTHILYDRYTDIQSLNIYFLSIQGLSHDA